MPVRTDVWRSALILPSAAGRRSGEERRRLCELDIRTLPLAVSQGEGKFPSDAIQAFDNSGAFSKYGYTATEFKSLFGQTR